MRKGVLWRSVQRLLDPDEDLIDVAVMWTRHRLWLQYSAAAFVGLMAVAILAGFDLWVSRIALGLAGAALAASATTNYRVLALTTTGLVLCQAGRIRQVAREILTRLPEATLMDVVGSTLITTDWTVDGVTYTVPRNSQQAMSRIVGRR